MPAAVRELLDKAPQRYSGEARAIIAAALARLIDYQDADYAREFLARLARVCEIERAHGDGSGRLLTETARQLALAMAYEDTIRVADLKIRKSRFARVREEVEIGPGQILEIAEFLHPRVQEIADTLPAPLGRFIVDTPWARGLLDRATRKGKVIKTTSIAGFLLLYLISRLKPLRRRSLRFAREQAALARWLDLVAETARSDHALALQVARMRGLVKGYGDTHERGLAKFEKLAALLPGLPAQGNSAVVLESLIKAAQADESGQALAKAISELTADSKPRASTEHRVA
jgi:indolepyruvate ferredoxin oxidoreductase beta subunit